MLNVFIFTKNHRKIGFSYIKCSILMIALVHFVTVCGKYNAIGSSYDCSAGVSGEWGDASGNGDDVKVIQNRPCIRVVCYWLARRTSYIVTANLLNFFNNLRKISFPSWKCSILVQYRLDLARVSIGKTKLVCHTDFAVLTRPRPKCRLRWTNWLYLYFCEKSWEKIGFSYIKWLILMIALVHFVTVWKV